MFLALVAITVSLISAAIAALSLSVSWRSFGISRRAFAAANADCAGYMVDSFRYKPNGGKMLYVACVEIRNEATNANSLAGVDARLAFEAEGRVIEVILEHRAECPTAEEAGIRNLLPVPFELRPRGIAKGTVCFELAASIAPSSSLERFTVECRMAVGPAVILPTLVLADILDAEHLEAKRRSGVPI